MLVEGAQTRHEQVTSANLKVKWWKLLYSQILPSNNRHKGFIGTTSNKPTYWNPERQKKSIKRWAEIAFEQWLKIARLDRWYEHNKVKKFKTTPAKMIWKRPTAVHMEIKSQ